jgi:transcriptional regulator with XRE-family HTH domain
MYILFCIIRNKWNIHKTYIKYKIFLEIKEKIFRRIWYNLHHMSKKMRMESNFGERLVTLRKAAGLTQVQLARYLGTTQRAISYYENEASYPPAHIIADLAKALNISTDELMGISSTKITKSEDNPELRKLWSKFQQILTLPEKDQRAIIQLVNSLVNARTNQPSDAF